MSAKRVVGFSVLALAVGSATLIPVAGAGAQRSAANRSSRPITAYVVNTGDGTVTPINTETNIAGDPISVGVAPVAIAITPDGSRAYVTLSDSPGSVVPIDLSSNTPGSPIPVGRNPKGIAITPDGTTAYVANYFDRSVTAIDLATNKPVATIGVGFNAGYPETIAITPNGRTAYVTGGPPDSNFTVAPLDIATNTFAAPIPVPFAPVAIAITPDGATAYVVIYNHDGRVIPIDIATNTGGTPIHIGRYSWSIGISPDGEHAYTTSWSLSAVNTIKIATNTTVKRIPVGLWPSGVAFTPDGSAAYITNQHSNSVTPIDVKTSTPGTPIDVGGGPQGIAITPDQAPVAQFTETVAPHGKPTGFDASASLPGSSPIVKYWWRFGDGKSAITAGPVASHVYSAAGAYTVVLKVRDAAGTGTEQVFTGQTVSRNGTTVARAQHDIAIN